MEIKKEIIEKMNEVLECDELCEDRKKRIDWCFRGW